MSYVMNNKGQSVNIQHDENNMTKERGEGRRGDEKRKKKRRKAYQRDKNLRNTH